MKMNNRPLVSVVIPFFNAERFLREAVKSVLAQSCQDWELLLVDDGSTDSSLQIAQQYTATYPDRMHLLAHPGHRNLGVSASRNLGVRCSRGEYIAFLDSDDVWLPNKLERQLAILRLVPEAGMTCGPSELWHSWKPDATAVDAVFPLRGAADCLVAPPELLLRWYPLGRSAPGTASLLLRRRLIESVGGFEEKFAGLMEDQALLAKVYLSAPVFVSSECLVRYRIHDASLCGRATLQDHDAACLLFLHWLEGYLRKQRIANPEIRRALNRTLWRYRHPAVLGWARRAKQISSRIMKRECLSGPRASSAAPR